MLLRAHFFWDYSGYSHSGLGITEYTEYQFPKERVLWTRNTGGGGDLRTIVSEYARVANDLGWPAAFDFPPKLNQKNAYSAYSE